MRARYCSTICREVMVPASIAICSWPIDFSNTSKAAEAGGACERTTGEASAIARPHAIVTRVAALFDRHTGFDLLEPIHRDDEIGRHLSLRSTHEHETAVWRDVVRRWLPELRNSALEERHRRLERQIGPRSDRRHHHRLAIIDVIELAAVSRPLRFDAAVRRDPDGRGRTRVGTHPDLAAAGHVADIAQPS